MGAALLRYSTLTRRFRASFREISFNLHPNNVSYLKVIYSTTVINHLSSS